MTCIALIFATPIAAQRLAGKLVEVGTGDPIGAGFITLLTGDSTAVATAVTDDQGDWIVEAEDEGFYWVLVRRLGYRVSLVGPLKLESGRELEGVFRLERLPVVLDDIEISAEAMNARLDDVGFYRRQRANRGSFIGRDEIERRLGAVSDPAQLLRTVPGVNVIESLGGASLGFTRGYISGRGCLGPRIYVDGFLVSDGGGPPLAVVVRAEDVVAMEVYRTPSQIPAQYGGAQAACGVLLVWTLSGN